MHHGSEWRERERKTVPWIGVEPLPPTRVLCRRWSEGVSVFCFCYGCGFFALRLCGFFPFLCSFLFFPFLSFSFVLSFSGIVGLCSFLFFPFLFVLSVSGIVGQRWLLSVASGETGLNGTRASGARVPISF